MKQAGSTDQDHRTREIDLAVLEQTHYCPLTNLSKPCVSLS